jgi:hypothetical protein
MPRPLYPEGKSPWYPLDSRLSGPQSWSGRGGEEQNSQLLTGLEPPIIHPIAQRYTTELSRLHRKKNTFYLPLPQLWDSVFRHYFQMYLPFKILVFSYCTDIQQHKL